MAASIRAAGAADIREIVRLACFMYASVGIDPADAWTERVTWLLSGRLGAAGLTGWVVDGHEGALAACALLSIAPSLPLPGQTASHSGYLQWVVTDPRYQRQGLGAALTSTAMVEAKARGLDVVTLHSSPAGRRLYEKSGFVASPRVNYPDDVRGVPMTWRVT